MVFKNKVEWDLNWETIWSFVNCFPVRRFKVRHPAIEPRRSRFSEIRVLWSRYYTEKKLCQA